MTATDLEALFKANLGTGLLEALEAVYTHGWCDGTGVTPTATTTPRPKSAPVPVATIILKHPDMR